MAWLLLAVLFGAPPDRAASALLADLGSDCCDVRQAAHERLAAGGDARRIWIAMAATTDPEVRYRCRSIFTMRVDAAYADLAARRGRFPWITTHGVYTPDIPRARAAYLERSYQIIGTSEWCGNWSVATQWYAHDLLADHLALGLGTAAIDAMLDAMQRAEDEWFRANPGFQQFQTKRPARQP